MMVTDITYRQQIIYSPLMVLL